MVLVAGTLLSCGGEGDPDGGAADGGTVDAGPDAGMDAGVDGGGDTVPPRVDSQLPARNATDVSPTTGLSFNFSEGMDTSSVERSFGAVPAIPATFSWTLGDVIFRIRPTDPLLENQLYEVTLTTDAMDKAGNPLAAPYVVSFTTGVTLDQTPPTIVDSSPVDGATGVGLSTLVTITFSEPMNRSVAETGFGVTPVVTASITWSNNDTVLTWTPVVPLSGATLYGVNVLSSVEDLAGNTLGTSFSYSFTTL